MFESYIFACFKQRVQNAIGSMLTEGIVSTGARPVAELWLGHEVYLNEKTQEPAGSNWVGHTEHVC